MTQHIDSLDSMESARAVRDGGIEAVAALNAALARAIDGLPPEKAQSLKSSFGKVMGAIVLELINPTIEAFPELEPDEAIWSAVANTRPGRRPVE